MNTRSNQQLVSIEVTQLSDVTGGGLWGSAFKLAEKAVPLVKRAAPFLAHKAVDVAKWTGIPAALGAGASWVKHEFTH
jgi:selenophosphate synthase